MGTGENTLNYFAEIQSIAKHVANSLYNRRKVCDFCWQIDNVFPSHILDTLNNFLEINTHWEKVDLQTDWPRRAVHWDQPDTSPYKQMHFVFQQLTPVIRGIFDEQVEFAHSNMWEDSIDYTIPAHVDNNNINFALQIYLNDADPECGTCMYDPDGDIIYKVPFMKNTGYILKNSAHSWHGMMTPGSVRRSLYVNYR